jgi:hypothetical protein
LEANGGVLSRRFLLAGTLALAGCASLPRSQAWPTMGPFPELEAVRSVRVTPGGLSVEVASRGCAAPPDLAFFVERRDGVATVAFARRRLQTCREAPGGWVEVTFTREALGLKPDEPVFVLNPLSSGPDR